MINNCFDQNCHFLQNVSIIIKEIWIQIQNMFQHLKTFETFMRQNLMNALISSTFLLIMLVQGGPYQSYILYQAGMTIIICA